MFNLINSLTGLQKSLVVSIISIILFVTSAGVSYSAFSRGAGTTGGNGELITSLPGPDAPVVEDPSEPKTESCPLNGAMHTKKSYDNWITRRPLAVMIDNHSNARPQAGLTSADVVYEAIAEGGITRFMAVYLCNLSDVRVGPIRSARTYYLDWLSEYDALYSHVGGANCNEETGSGCANGAPADALGQIEKYKIKDIGQSGVSFPTYFRDFESLKKITGKLVIDAEHTMYATTQKLWAVGAKRGWVVTDQMGKKWETSFIPWKFKDDTSSSSQIAADKINVEFWQVSSDYSVTWKYDGTCNCYKRENGGSPHVDMNNNQQLSAKNIIVQFERESRANDGYDNNVHLLYGTIGSGKALFFQDGKVIEGKWSKASRLARSKYVDSKGKEIDFNKGVIWIQTVPEGARVSY